MTVVVLVLTLAACASATVLTRDVLRENEHRLLSQKASEGSLVLASLLSQFYGAAGDGLAAAVGATGTVDVNQFRATASAVQSQAGTGLGSVAVVDLRRHRVLAQSGSTVLDLTSTGSQQSLSRAAAAAPLAVVGIANRDGHRALGLLKVASPTTAAYLELPLTPETTYQADTNPSGQRSNQPFSGLDYAVYVGDPSASHLVWTNRHRLPLKGELVRANAPLSLDASTTDGKGGLVIVLRARTPLIGPFAATLPWLILFVGMLGGLAGAAVLEKSQRRRDAALLVVAELEQRNLEVQEAVSRQARAEERLRQAQRLEAVGQLAGGIAHDFNNLLAVIFSYTGFLHTAAEGQPWAEDVDEVDKAARRAAELTQQLLLFSRRDLVRPDVLDARDLLSDRRKLLQRTLSDDIDVLVELPDHPVTVRADSVELDQVVMNLAVNARDAMPGGGTLLISLDEIAREDGEALVRIQVRDTGIGMPPEVRDHAFEPFFTTKEVGRGTGLGLATVYGIVTRWGGTVALSSECGVGTTVTVLLPRCNEDVQTSPERRPRPTRTEQATVLLVEDEDTVRRASTRILREAGYHVVEAASGPEALERYKDQPVDVLVSDVVMPGGMSGADLASTLIQLQPDLRVVLASGYSRDHLDRRGPLPGGTHLLRKPFPAQTLLDAVSDTLAAEQAVA